MRGTGSSTAKILILKDTPSFDEMRSGTYLADAAGFEFKKMLSEAGISENEIFTTSVSKTVFYGKSEEYFTEKAKAPIPLWEGKVRLHPKIVADLPILFSEIEALKPHIIVPLGPLSLYLMNKETSLNTWRGSCGMGNRFNIKFIPTLNPEMIVKVWNWRYQAVRDLQRVKYESLFPKYLPKELKIKIAPSFTETMIQLQRLINKADELKRVID